MGITSVNSKWNLIIIDDPAFLQGKSIFDILNLLISLDKFKFVILYDILGFAQNGLMATLSQKENTAIEVNTFLDVVCNVKQFEWGDFFLFKEYPRKWNNSQDRFYPNLIAQTDATVRAVDNQYIHIYTPDQLIMDGIIKNHKVEEIKKDLLEKLDHPY